MLEQAFKIIFCHLVGDYVLQNDFIAATKGTNWYHLLIHCFLYVLPFYVCFGFDWRLVALLVSHIIIDPAKARWGKITYVHDQLLHYLICVAFYL